MSEPWFGRILKNHKEADQILDAIKADPFLRLERGNVVNGYGSGDWLVFLDPPEGYQNADGPESVETIQESCELAKKFGEHPYFTARMGSPHHFCVNPLPPIVVGHLESLRTWREVTYQPDVGPEDWGLDNIYHVCFLCGFDPTK